MKVIKKIITNPKVENFLGRVLYFHNTLDTHFILMGVVTIFTYHLLVTSLFDSSTFISFLLYGFFVAIFFGFAFKIGDFYVTYLIFAPLLFYFLFWSVNFDFSSALTLVGVYVIWFFVSQFIFFGAAYVVILNEPSTPFRIAFNSLFTLASTTASFIVCSVFTSLFILTWAYRPNLLENRRALIFFLAILAASLLTRAFIPRNRKLKFSPPKKKVSTKTKRVIILNIDGCSFHKFSQAKKPNIEKLIKRGAFYKKGALTIYRGLTNPAFASMLTGTVPSIHGVVDNNITSKVKIRALPDIVETKIYGCVHMKQFAKKDWQVKIVSLPEYGFGADDVVLEWVKKDVQKDKGTKLFVVDLSSVDMSGHAFGSYSRQYLAQITQADKLVGDFIDWLESNKLLKDSLVIISSDHGMWGIDHVYLLSSQERQVPLIFLGPQVKKGIILDHQPSIMDIAPTISYALGIDYLDKMRAKVLEEIFK